jgi:hypothetical protein
VGDGELDGRRRGTKWANKGARQNKYAQRTYFGARGWSNRPVYERVCAVKRA